jgi:ribosomal-protein-alanine N-acetyltransferase
LSYKIRYMRKEDLHQVVEIDKEAFPTQWPPTNYGSELQNKLARYLVVYKEGEFLELPNPPSGNTILVRIKKLLGFKQKVVTRPQEIIVGFAGGWIMADELHITEIAVRGSYRCRGIGHLLLISIIETSLPLRAQYATLEVRVTNIPAQKLYEEFGFAKVGVRKAYYSDNREDALIMTTDPINTLVYQQLLGRLKQELAKKWGLVAIPVIPESARAK